MAEAPACVLAPRHLDQLVATGLRRQPAKAQRQSEGSGHLGDGAALDGELQHSPARVFRSIAGGEGIEQDREAQGELCHTRVAAGTLLERPAGARIEPRQLPRQRIDIDRVIGHRQAFYALQAASLAGPDSGLHRSAVIAVDESCGQHRRRRRMACSTRQLTTKHGPKGARKRGLLAAAVSQVPRGARPG